MKKIIIAVLFSVFLSGCFYQSVNEFDMQKAEYACKDKGGVFEVWASFDGGEGVQCKNGHSLNLSRVTIDFQSR